MERVLSTFFAVLFVLVSSSKVWASEFDKLSPDDQEFVLSGKPLDYEVNADGTDWDQSSWPRITVYRLVNATPEETMAVMWDFPLQPKYMTDTVVSSVVSANPTPNQAKVDYVVKLPIYGNTSYTVLDTISSYDKGSSFKFGCQLVSGSMVKSIDGTALFEPHTLKDGSTVTIMIYSSLIVPKLIPASSLTTQAGIDSFKGTVNAIAKQVEQEKTGADADKALLPPQVASLRASLMAAPAESATLIEGIDEP